MSDNWQLATEIQPLDPKVIQYGDGFLKSKPANWIPNFSSFWAPLLDLLNFEFTVLDIQPTFEIGSTGNSLWLGAFDQNKIGISCEPFVAKYLASLFVPEIDSSSSKILEDYLARRLIKSLVSSWIGPLLGQFVYLGVGHSNDFEPAAGIKLTMSINGRQVILWLLMEEFLLNKLDSLWRRQTTTFNVKKLEARKYQIVLASQQIELNDLGDLLVIGNKIYLSGLDFNHLLMQDVVDDAIWKVKLVSSEQQLVLKILESDLFDHNESRDLVLRVIFPEFSLSTEQIQLCTNETFLPTGLSLESNLQIKVSDEIVAEAQLGKDDNGYYAQILT